MAAIEALAKFTPVGEFRRTLIWLSLTVMIAYVMVSYLREGSLGGFVTYSGSDRNGQYVTARVPDVRIILENRRTKHTYTTVSLRGSNPHGAAAHGSYRLRGMPVGDYTLIAVDPRTGAWWRGEVYVDYAIIQGSQVEIPLIMPGQSQAQRLSFSPPANH